MIHTIWLSMHRPTNEKQFDRCWFVDALHYLVGHTASLQGGPLKSADINRRMRHSRPNLSSRVV